MREEVGEGHSQPGFFSLITFLPVMCVRPSPKTCPR